MAEIPSTEFPGQFHFLQDSYMQSWIARKLEA